MLRTRTNDEVEILKLVTGEDLFVVEDENGYYHLKIKNHSFKEIENYDILKIDNSYYYKMYVNDTNVVYRSNDETGWTQSIELAINDDNELIFNNYEFTPVQDWQFYELVEVTPTDVRLIEDQGKLQLQLEHDSQVLSIDEDVNNLLGSKVGYSFNQENTYQGEISFSDGSSRITLFFERLLVHRFNMSEITNMNLIDFLNDIPFFGVITYYGSSFDLNTIGIIVYYDNYEASNNITSFFSLPFDNCTVTNRYTGEQYSY